MKIKFFNAIDPALKWVAGYSRRCAILMVMAAVSPYVSAETANALSTLEQSTAPIETPEPFQVAGVMACFVKNCAACSQRNPYVCSSCATGYQLTSALACFSCAVNYEQNLDERTFVCTACPPGTMSKGGQGLNSKCVPRK